LKRVLPENLKEGDLLALPVLKGHSDIVLLQKGTVIKKEHIDLLQNMEISAIYIEEPIEVKNGKEESLAEDQDAVRQRIIEEALPQPVKKLYLACEESLNEIFNNVRAGDLSDVPKVKETAKNLAKEISYQPQLWQQIAMLKNKDQYSAVHSINVALFTIFLALRKGYYGQKLEEIATAALLHDIGKLEIPLSILNKKGKLSEKEWKVIKEHPLSGYKKLKEIEGISDLILNTVLSHHERLDRQGYPFGLGQDSIPEAARIAAVADVYDALTTDRAYRARLLPHEALDVLLAEATENKLDPELVELFVRTVAPYPVGTKLLLSDGRKVVVLKIPPRFPFRPEVETLDTKEKIELIKNPSLTIRAVLDYSWG